VDTNFVITKRGKYKASISSDTPNIIIGDYIIVPKNISDYVLTTDVNQLNHSMYHAIGQRKSPCKQE
jgi:hypothetical protein